MLLQTENQTIEVQGATEDATSFRIAMNGKAFKVLSSTMYANKIGSIVREISTNALDAHIMNGNADEPFVIHLPDQFEPWFSVQDFGIGLSVDGVKNLYSTYFASTKDQSNDCVGSFGLGSKVPFSYTDQFSVTSTFDGMKHLFSAYLAPSGVPAVQLMHSEPTNDRNGVEIRISAKREDYGTFANEVKDQLKFFKVKPVVTNYNYDFTFLNNFEADIIASTEKFKLVKNRYTGTFIVQGPVGYPFDLQLFNSKSTNERAKIIANRLQLAGSFVLYCDIGSIGVTASREAMEYTGLTIKTIETGLLAAYDEIQQSFAAKVSQSATNWEIAQISNETDMFGDKEIYKKAFNKSSKVPEIFRNVFTFVLDPLKFVANLNNTYNRKGFSSAIQNIQATGSMNIYVLDECKYQRNRLAELRSRENFTCIRLLDGASTADLIEALGGYSGFKRISDVPYTPTPRGASKGPKTSCWKYKTGEGPYLRDWYKVRAENAPEDEDCVYVEVENLNLVNNDDVSSIWSYQEFLNICMHVPALFGIRTKDVKSFKENNPDAIALGEWLAEKQNELLPQLRKAVKYEQLHAALNINLSYDIKQILVQGSFGKFGKLIALEDSINAKRNAKMLALAKRFGIVVDNSTSVQALLKLKEVEVGKRPLLKLSAYELRNKLSTEQLQAYLAVEL